MVYVRRSDGVRQRYNISAKRARQLGYRHKRKGEPRGGTWIKKRKPKQHLYEVTAVARIRFSAWNTDTGTPEDAFIEVMVSEQVKSTPQGLRTHKKRLRKEATDALIKGLKDGDIDINQLRKVRKSRKQVAEEVGIEHRRYKGRRRRKAPPKVDIRPPEGISPEELHLYTNLDKKLRRGKR
jgi:hypothetical protein